MYLLTDISVYCTVHTDQRRFDNWGLWLRMAMAIPLIIGNKSFIIRLST